MVLAKAGLFHCVFEVCERVNRGFFERVLFHDGLFVGELLYDLDAGRYALVGFNSLDNSLGFIPEERCLLKVFFLIL